MARQTPDDNFFDKDIIEDTIYLSHDGCKIIFTRDSLNRGCNKTCAWLIVGQKTTCGARCFGDYCKFHSEKFIWGKKPIPVPCSLCGKGVQSAIQVCSACGQEKIRRRHIALEKKS